MYSMDRNDVLQDIENQKPQNDNNMYGRSEQEWVMMIDEKNRIIRNLSSKLTILENGNIELKDQIRGLAKENRELKKENRELKDHNDELSHEIEELKSRNGIHEKQSEQLRNDFDALKKLFENLNPSENSVKSEDR